MHFVLGRQLVAEIALLGMGVETLGGLYLAYDLLGGKQGPLRVITRATGYSVLFFIGYTIVLGVQYSIIASSGMGLLLAVEFGLAEQQSDDAKAKKLRIIAFGFLRGLVVGLAAWTAFGFEFGVIFGILSGVGLTTVYLAGYAPTDDYTAQSSPGINAHKLIASVLRGVAVSIAGIITGVIVQPDSHFWTVGLKLGLAAGTVSTVVTLFSPVLEWKLENLPERRLGLIGLTLLFMGTIVQSLQYWIVVFNVPVR